MKSRFLLMFAMLISFQSFSQKKVGTQNIDLTLIPSGESLYEGNKISVQAFYISNEITNKQYRAFTDYAIQHPNEGLSYNDASGKIHFMKYWVMQKDIIDSTVMEKAAGSNFKNYFTNPAFDEYPVVGVSLNDAIWFCAWMMEEEKKLGHNTDALIRIPFAEEWYYAAQSNAFNRAEPQKYQGVTVGVKNKSGLYHFTDNPDEYCETMYGKIFIMGEEKPQEMKTDYNSLNQKSALVGFRIVQTSLEK